MAAPTISTIQRARGRESGRAQGGEVALGGRRQGYLDESRPCLIATLRQRDVGLARSKDFGLAWPDGSQNLLSSSATFFAKWLSIGLPFGESDQLFRLR